MRTQQPKFRLLTTSCRRCNKPLATGNRSLYGNDALKARLDRICGECITPEERREIETLMRSVVIGGAR